MRTILAQTTGGSFEKKKLHFKFLVSFQRTHNKCSDKVGRLTVESPGANLVSNIAFRRFIPLWETTEC